MKAIITLLLLAIASAVSAAINHVSITKGPVVVGSGIVDDFGSDTSANYTLVSGSGIAVSGGVLKADSWQIAWAYHETSTASNNNYAQALAAYPAEFEAGGVIARVTPGATPTGYQANIIEGDVYLRTFSGSTLTDIGYYDGTYAYGANTYTIRLECNGSTIKVFVDSVERISVTDATYSTGAYVGVYSKCDGDSNAYVDTFRGGAL